MLHIQSINSFGNNNNSSLDFYSFCFGNGLKLIFIACCVYIYDTASLQQMFSKQPEDTVVSTEVSIAVPK